jgi:hypothetical protein
VPPHGRVVHHVARLRHALRPPSAHTHKRIPQKSLVLFNEDGRLLKRLSSSSLPHTQPHLEALCVSELGVCGIVGLKDVDPSAAPHEVRLVGRAEVPALAAHNLHLRAPRGVSQGGCPALVSTGCDDTH